MEKIINFDDTEFQKQRFHQEQVATSIKNRY